MELRIPGLKLIRPRVFRDERGFFFEGYHEARYGEAGIDVRFVQDNVSSSKRGVVRGLHLQPGQAKLVSVSVGKIWDVAVDLREGSPTWGQWEAVELEGEAQFFIPDGFAHGFCVLSEEARVHYKVSALYDPVRERSVRWNDPRLGVRWPVEAPVLSLRDAGAPCV